MNLLRNIHLWHSKNRKFLCRVNIYFPVESGAQVRWCGYDHGTPHTLHTTRQVSDSRLLLSSCNLSLKFSNPSNPVNVSGPAVIAGRRAKVSDQTLHVLTADLWRRNLGILWVCVLGAGNQVVTPSKEQHLWLIGCFAAFNTSSASILANSKWL